MRAEQKIRYLKIELTKARTEAAELRKKLQLNSRHAKRVDKAYEDALLLAIWHVSGIVSSRSYARRYGITQNRWESALGLLRMARIVVRRRHWVANDLSLIEVRLSKAKIDAIEYPDAFRARLNRHAAR